MRIAHRLSFFLVVMMLAAACVAGSALAAPNSEHPFEIEPGSFRFAPSGDQAGSHADWVTEFNFAHEHNASEHTYNDLRTTVVNLPPGFIGNNNAVPTCTDTEFLAQGPPFASGTLCPPASQVGTISLDLTLQSGVPEHITDPVYNMEVTSPGIAAGLGFKITVISQILSVRVRPGDEGLTVTSPSLTEIGEPHDVKFTVWGVPAAHEHDAERGMVCEEFGAVGTVECEGGGEEAKIPAKPFLTDPTSCESGTASIEASSWEEPGEPGNLPAKATYAVPPAVECERVPFNPSIAVQPTTRSVETSSGLDISLLVPQTWEKPETLSTSNLLDTTLALPVGYTANPSLAVGLGTCTPQQLEAETPSSLPGEGCPQESKIGVVSVETPVLAEKLTGNIYIATPFDNKFDALLGLYIVVKSYKYGIVVKLQGHIEPNIVTGQLVTTFDENPQVPFSKFTLELSQDAASPLVSPAACGSYIAEAQLTPWSAALAEQPRFVDSPPFAVETGIGGGPCPGGGAPPFNPGLIAGTLNNSAGSYSPLDLDITRNDGEQEITGFASQLPSGLTANLSGVPFCPEADIQAARETSGAQQEADPSCPAASEIGHTLVGAGVGKILAYTPGKVYLGGPFEGAPFSIVSITSAKVGPFDLGTVVVHLPLNINPETAAVSIPAGAADQIPHIIKGIVIHVREIHVYIDRSDFMINPTNCNSQTLSATVIGGGADPTDIADEDPATTSTHFQDANCQNLKFAPKFSVSTSGKTSKADGASLTAKLVYPTAPQGTQSNIKEVKVDLPKQLPSRLTTLQKACTAAQFNTNPAGCPAASVIGHAKAITPILPVPIEGPAYFVSHGGEAFPDLEIVLQGYGVKIILTGNTFISKTGITSSTFKTVPDQPVTSFELTLPESKYSALAANGNLCAPTKTVTTKKTVKEKIHGKTKKVTRKTTKQVAAPLTMPTEFAGQNGATIKQTTTISVTGCPKAVKAKAKKKGKPKKKDKQKNGKH